METEEPKHIHCMKNKEPAYEPTLQDCPQIHFSNALRTYNTV